MEQLRQVEVRIPAKNVITDKGTIEVPPKLVNGAFHGWEDYKSEEHSCKYAIVELEDGKVYKYEPHEIRFTGKPAGANMFEDGELTPE